MQKEINLLARKNVGFLQQEQTITVARVIAVFSVILVASSFVALFFLQKNYSLSTIENQQTSVRSRLSLLHDKTIKQLTLIDRTKKIELIIKKRISLADKITLLQKEIPSALTIETLSVSKEAMSITVTSNSLTSLQKFIESLTTLVTKKTLLQKLTIDNVIINQQTGLYSVSVKGVFL